MCLNLTIRNPVFASTHPPFSMILCRSRYFTSLKTKLGAYFCSTNYYILDPPLSSFYVIYYNLETAPDVVLGNITFTCRNVMMTRIAATDSIFLLTCISGVQVILRHIWVYVAASVIFFNFPF